VRILVARISLQHPVKLVAGVVGAVVLDQALTERRHSPGVFGDDLANRRAIHGRILFVDGAAAGVYQMLGQRLNVGVAVPDTEMSTFVEQPSLGFAGRLKGWRWTTALGDRVAVEVLAGVGVVIMPFQDRDAATLAGTFATNAD